MTDDEREELADTLNEAWEILRHVPGGHGHVTDACLEAARFIRPAVSNSGRGESENDRS